MYWTYAFYIVMHIDAVVIMPFIMYLHVCFAFICNKAGFLLAQQGRRELVINLLD